MVLVLVDSHVRLACISCGPSLPLVATAIAATKLAPANFTANHPRVWPLIANLDGLFAVFQESLVAQYDAYDTVARPKLKQVSQVGVVVVGQQDTCVLFVSPFLHLLSTSQCVAHSALLVHQLTQFNGMCLAAVIILVIVPISMKVRLAVSVQCPGRRCCQSSIAFPTRFVRVSTPQLTWGVPHPS